MASTDFAPLNDGAAASTFARGVTTGQTPPNGGLLHTYVFNSITSGVTAAAGLRYTGVNFDPYANSGRITAAVKRLPSGGPTGFAPMLYVNLQGNSVNDTGYILGLQDASPSFIALRKGSLATGLADGPVSPLSNGILRRSSQSFSPDTWVHLRLDAETTGTGDVRLSVFMSDLAVNPVTAPVWVPVPGMDVFVDDIAQVNTGSAPLNGGRVGFAFWANDITRRAAFDHITIARQQ